MTPRFYVGSLNEMTLGSSEAENGSFPRANLLTYIASDLWKSVNANNNQTLTFDFGSARPRNFCIIELHNFSGMTTVVLEAADNSGYSTNLTTVISQMVTPLTPAKFEFSPVNKRYWRIKFTNTNSVTPQLGQIFIDQKVEFAQTYDFGYKPKNEDFDTAVSRSISGIERASQVYAGILRYDIKFSNVTGRFLEDYRWLIQKVRGRLNPCYFYDHDDNVYYVKLGNDYNPAEVKAYKIGDTVVIPLVSQGVAQNPYTQQTNPMCVDLDGSTEYCSKASPSNLDMNGSELLTNGGFETHTGSLDDGIADTFTAWYLVTPGGRAESTATLKSGSAALKFVRTGAGDLVAIQDIVVIPGKKYTLEFWTRGDGTNQGFYYIYDNTNGVYILNATNTGVPGTAYSKVVKNFIAPAGCIDVQLAFYGSTAGSSVTYYDDISATEAYDFTILAWVKTSATGEHRIAGSRTPGDTALKMGSTNKAVLNLNDAFNSNTIVSTTAINDSIWRLLATTFNRTGNANLLINGISEGSPVSLVNNYGKIFSSGTFFIGVYADLAQEFWNGQIGEVQIVRGYAMTAAQIADIYAKGIPKSYDQTQFPNATVVAHYKWRGVSDADFLKDETGYNNLTGANVTQVLDQAIGSYQCIDL